MKEWGEGGREREEGKEDKDAALVRVERLSLPMVESGKAVTAELSNTSGEHV